VGPRAKRLALRLLDDLLGRLGHALLAGNGPAGAEPQRAAAPQEGGAPEAVEEAGFVSRA
jgi:hypothetical protein